MYEMIDAERLSLLSIFSFFVCIKESLSQKESYPQIEAFLEGLTPPFYLV